MFFISAIMSARLNHVLGDNGLHLQHWSLKIVRDSKFPDLVTAELSYCCSTAIVCALVLLGSAALQLHESRADGTTSST